VECYIWVSHYKHLEVMIKFLRIIRQKLISKNKIGKYVSYAIGEVFLVVIGILIALSINNWNERQKDERKTINYITNLIENLDDDIASFESSISFNKTRLRGILYILDHAGLSTQKFTEMEWVDISENDYINDVWQEPFPESLNQKFTELSFSMLGRGFGAISLNKSVINELYSTGYFSYIQNADLKDRISSYYSFLAKRLEGYAIEEHEEWANETTRFLRDKYGVFTLDVDGLEDPITILKGKKDVEFHLRYLALEVNYHCIWTADAKERALELKRLVQNEINSMKQ